MEQVLKDINRSETTVLNYGESDLRAILQEKPYSALEKADVISMWARKRNSGISCSIRLLFHSILLLF